VFWISPQLDILCASAVKRYYAKMTIYCSRDTSFPVHGSKSTCYKLFRTSIWLISYSEKLCSTNNIVKTNEALIVWSVFAPIGPVDPKFQVEGIAPTNHSSSQKTRLNDLSYSIKIWTIFLPCCHSPRVWQTDRQTPFSSLVRAGIPCSAKTTTDNRDNIC